MATLQQAEAAIERELSRARHAYRLGIGVAVAAVAVAIVLLPLGASSLLAVLQRPVEGHVYDLMRPAGPAADSTRLEVTATSLNEAAQTVTLRVSGFHNCQGGCPDVERVQFFSVHADSAGALGAPPSATIDLPKTSDEVSQQITLPVRGNLVDYPFDHYRLLLGVTFSRVSASGAAVAFSPRAADRQLAYSFGDAIPRASMSAPTLLAPQPYDSPGVRYDSIAGVELSRPAYLQVLNVDLIVLIVIAALYGVAFRPFTQIVPTVGGVVLGVWGVRSLLVGSYPPDSTGVDLVLESAILLVLLVVGVRSVRFMWPNARGRSQPPPQP